MLRPFNKLCIGIGAVPSAFEDSMSWYEAIKYLVDYLTKEVIPAVNADTKLVNELKDYVEHYFDNLDVQEEINNKLDAMAESGQLADIIAAYLQLNGVLAYDTVLDMSEASNIVDGSFARTYGRMEYNDGYGAFYKIRTITSADVVDGENIVALDISETLIAEKIPDTSLADLTKKVDQDARVEAVKSIRSSVSMYPKLVVKAYENGKTGAKLTMQGMCCKYKANGTPETYYFVRTDSSSTAKLVIATAGSVDDGTGWSYTQVNLPNPAMHGSCLTYYNDRVYVSMDGSGIAGAVYYYDITDGAWKLQNVSDVISGTVLAVCYDRIRNEFLLASNNTNMIIADEAITTVKRTYTHQEPVNSTTNMQFQGACLHNGFEYRSLNTHSYQFENGVFVYDTFTGKLVKTINLNYPRGEVEQIAIDGDGYITVSVNSFGDQFNLIYMNAILEGYANIETTVDPVAAFNNRKPMGYGQWNDLAENHENGQWVIKYQNNHDNSEQVRYVGNGTQANPISSGLALVTSMVEYSRSHNQNVQVTVDVIGDGDNTDDNGIMLVGDNGNIQFGRLRINGGNHAFQGSISITRVLANELWLSNIDLASSSDTRRTAGQITLQGNVGYITFHNNNSCGSFNIIENNQMAVFDGGLTATGNSTLRYNTILYGDNLVTTTATLTKNRNIIGQ